MTAMKEAYFVVFRQAELGATAPGYLHNKNKRFVKTSKLEGGVCVCARACVRASTQSSLDERDAHGPVFWFENSKGTLKAHLSYLCCRCMTSALRIDM